MIHFTMKYYENRSTKCISMHDLKILQKMKDEELILVLESNKVFVWQLILTVLQIRENPKINAPGISKYPTERARNFLHKFKIS